MKMQKSTHWTLALALGLSSSLNAQTDYPKASIPKTMAASGDSITAGALAGFKRSDAHNPLVIFKFLYFIGKVGYTRSIYAFESRARSWATGDSPKVRTHASRLNELNASSNSRLAAYNASVSGATSHDIKIQIDSILSWSHKTLGQGAPDYVMLAIGANDACQNTNSEMTPVSTYANNVRNAIFRILEASDSSRVLVSGIPDLNHLRNVAEDSWLGLPPVSTCKQMWALHKFCNNVLVEKDLSKRAEVTKRIFAYQDELEYIRQEANARFGKDRVRFAFDVHNYRFTDDEISIDCFHPNVHGQQALSDVTWKKTWWSHLKP